jgi:UDP-glucuronate 4-epimerase
MELPLSSSFRALVTGCAGFIGSHLTESLLEDGHEVVGVDCFNANYGRRDKLRNLARARDWESFVFVPVDLSRGDLADLVSDVEVVFHLAAEPGVRTSWGAGFERYVANNVLATHQLLTALVDHPVRRLVNASSSSIYGQAETLPTPETATPAPLSPYGMTKLGAEHLCNLFAANHGLDVVSLRYFTVFGPRQRPDMAFHRFCRAALLDEEIRVLGDGRQTRDFTYVGDVVAATRAAAAADGVAGAVFNVGGGLRASVVDVIEILQQLTATELSVALAPTERGDVRDTGADTSRARARLGFEPRTDLRVGLAAELGWLQAELVPNGRERVAESTLS